MNRYQQEGEELASRIEPDLRRQLAEDPFGVVPEAFSLDVSILPAGNGDDECSCDGAFYAADRKVIVSETPFSRRSNFTILHEVGHDLVSQDGTLLSRLFEWDRANKGREAIEMVCDAFAAAILVPNALVDELLEDGRVRAASFVKLFKRSGGSREACAVRLAQRLPCEGHVMLAKPDGTAIFTASSADYRIARGVKQGAPHITVAAGRRGSARQESFVRFRSGREQPFWGDAALDESFVFAVLAALPQWPIEGPTILRRAREGAQALEGDCQRCGASFETYEAPCSKCGVLHCPECGRCECVSASSKRVCAACNLELPIGLFVDDSTVCRDCI